MKNLSLGLLLLILTVQHAEARRVLRMSEESLRDQSDLIVIAKYGSTRKTKEQWILQHISPDTHVVGVLSNFEIRRIIKGDAGLKKFTLHHYALRADEESEVVINGPGLISFEGTAAGTCYLLYLRHTAQDRYDPTGGQTDPGVQSVTRLGNAEC